MKKIRLLLAEWIMKKTLDVLPQGYEKQVYAALLIEYLKEINKNQADKIPVDKTNVV